MGARHTAGTNHPDDFGILARHVHGTDAGIRSDPHMLQMPIVSLLDEARRLAERGQRVSVLWQEADSLVFVARGREYRSEFHINPSDETMYMIKGKMNLH